MATQITVETIVNAPIGQVWDCWTLPEHIMQWNFAIDTWHCPKAENNPETGGDFCYTMAARDGSMSFDFEGDYDLVIPHQKIVYTLGDGRKATITFVEKDGLTTVTETFEAESTNPEDLQKAGWQLILDNFKGHVEGL